MRALLRGLLCVPMAVCIPAWGSGFCDGGSIPVGGSDCRQLSAAYTWRPGGAVVADYRDLDSSSLLGTSQELQFVLTLPNLPSSPTPAKVVVFEMTVLDSGGLAHTLSITVKRDGVNMTLNADWQSTDAYWSSADRPFTAPFLGQHGEYLLGSNASQTLVEIIPTQGWGAIAVRVDHALIGTFTVGGTNVASAIPLRMRSGVISANLLGAGMSVSLDYSFPSPPLR